MRAARRTFFTTLLALVAGCNAGSPADDASPGMASETEGTIAEGTASDTASGDGAGDGATSADSGASDAADTTSADGGDDGAMIDGQQLFLGMCAPCHGAEAEGTELAYELRHPTREHATWVIRNGRPGLEFPDTEMSAYPPEVVSDAQLEQIFDWLDSFPQPDTGEGLYMDYCRNCHGIDPASGGVIDEEIDEVSLGDILDQVREGEGGSDYGMRTGYMTAFGADRLTDAEIEAIVAWIAGG